MRTRNETRSKLLFMAMFIVGFVGIIYQNCGELPKDDLSGDNNNDNQSFDTMSVACKMDVDGNGTIEENDHEKLEFLMNQKMIPDQVKAKFDSNNDGTLDEKDLDYYASNTGDNCQK